ncbi:MAG TPA: hypothetical protein VGI16_02740 [Candidatus Acidoferrum sp.]|jgi:hypothetical protein
MKTLKKTFAIDPAGPRRLAVTYTPKLENAKVLLDGKEVIAFASPADFRRGTTAKMPDGSILTVRYGTIEGMPTIKNMPIFQGVHVIRNGAPVAGSAADPVPKWAWIFMGLSVLIPIVSLGGGVPAVLAVGGVGGTLTVSRMSRWSTALRVGVSALITAACWTGFLLLVAIFGAAKGGVSANTVKHPPVAKVSIPDKLIHEIGVNYYKHGYLQMDIEKIKNNLYDHCDQMQPAQCETYLRKALVDAINAKDIE